MNSLVHKYQRATFKKRKRNVFLTSHMIPLLAVKCPDAEKAARTWQTPERQKHPQDS